MPAPILLYDGVCGLCNRLVQFTLRRDRQSSFLFAALQSPRANRVLARHGANPTDLDTVYVVLKHDLPDESLLSRSDAVIFVLKQLGSFWRTCALLLQLVPRFFRDPLYNLIARHRYRVFGRSGVCTLPTTPHRSRFLDQ
jgi:predicted DCC family thiol-disulfide oxidoreductase YuxK